MRYFCLLTYFLFGFFWGEFVYWIFFPLDFGEVIFFTHIFSLWIFLRWVSLLIFFPLDFGEVFFLLTYVLFGFFWGELFWPEKNGRKNHQWNVKDLDSQTSDFFGGSSYFFHYRIWDLHLKVFNSRISDFHVKSSYLRIQDVHLKFSHLRIWFWNLKFSYLRVWDLHQFNPNPRVWDQDRTFYHWRSQNFQLKDLGCSSQIFLLEDLILHLKFSDVRIWDIHLFFSNPRI